MIYIGFQTVDAPEDSSVDTLSSLLQSSINSIGDNVSLEHDNMASYQSQAMPDIIKSRSTSTGM